LADNGLYVELGEYQCHVFLDWRFVQGGQWQQVCETLNGSGVQSIYGTYDEIISPKTQQVTETKPKAKRPSSPSVKATSSKKTVGKSSKPASSKKPSHKAPQAVPVKKKSHLKKSR
jgi:hypothetical protein